MQNIRAYEAERRTVDELRRLSALRADFVSLVSHELRSPMAAVIGSARTLQQRWRELSPEQRDAFLALIADETDRLADARRRRARHVPDRRRARSATASRDVDLARLVRDTVAAAELGQDEVAVVAERAAGRCRRCAATRERLRQVLAEPDRQRGQVLAGRRAGRGPRAGRGTARRASTSPTAAPGSPSRTSS